MSASGDRTWQVVVVQNDSAEVLAERLLRVIDEGRRIATYKLALLMALIDCCAAGADSNGRAPSQLHTRDIARQVLQLYLPQVRLYLGATENPKQLRQITQSNSVALRAVLRLHLLAESTGIKSVAGIALRLPSEYEQCLDVIEQAFARYPIRLLQTVGKENRPFLYEFDWTGSVSLKALHSPGGGVLRFKPGAADHLLRLAPLLRPLIELHWTRMVAQLNQIATEDQRLHDHLFGVERTAFPKTLRAGLMDLQRGRCFYCNSQLGVSTQVDHFVPWSRWPNNAMENLVLADSCNSHKSDYLPAMKHVENWSQRFVQSSVDLSQLAAESNWESSPTRSLSLARTCYAHLPHGTPFWLLARDFVEDNPAKITEALHHVALPTTSTGQ
ncbi:MAG: HNH endonuclease domain-containing protein [Microthrixaceae bacterium]